MSGRLPAGVAHWVRDIDSTLPVTSQYIVHGNIRDRHLMPGDKGRLDLVDTVPALWACLTANDSRVLLVHSPVHGLSCYPHTDDARRAAEELLEGSDVRLDRPLSFDLMVDVLTRVTRSDRIPCALLLDYVSQVATRDTPAEDLHRLMLASLDRVHAAQVHARPDVRTSALPNPVFWFVDRPADLPPWMVGGSDRIRQVPLPLPDLEARTRVAQLWSSRLPEFDPEQAEAVVERFAASTEGMTARAMQDSVLLARDGGIPAARIDDAVRAHRVGLMENVWKQPLLRSKIQDGEKILSGWVKGQPRAVRHALDVLVRSTLGLGGAFQRSTGGGPRGVLFFAGPTGVGKTELAKSITKLLFGDERAYIRFDMSEFASEHTEARLIGSPPGYVGYGSGGELTNAVRQRPFSVVLFDEIEKAHPQILDKFLQILSDGRLTDGSGATVHFSECVIVFTSNLGVAEAEERLAANPEAEYESTVKQVIREVFSDPNGINRPELMGRIGTDNIVVFDRLNSETARELALEFVGNVQRRVLDETGTRLQITDAVRSRIVDAAVTDLRLGGRGVGVALESVFVNPLSRELIHHGGRADITVAEFVINSQGLGEVTLR